MECRQRRHVLPRVPLREPGQRLQSAGHHHLHQLYQYRRGGGQDLLLPGQSGEQRGHQRVQQHRQRQGQDGHARRALRDRRQFLHGQAAADMEGRQRCGEVRGLPLHAAEHRLQSAGHYHLYQLHQHRGGDRQDLLLPGQGGEPGRRGQRVQQHRQRQGQGGGARRALRDRRQFRYRQAAADVEGRQRRGVLPHLPLREPGQRLQSAGHHHLYQLRQHRRGDRQDLLLPGQGGEPGRRGQRVQQHRQRQGHAARTGAEHRALRFQRQAEADMERRQRRHILPRVPLREPRHRLQPAGDHLLHQLCQHRRGGGQDLLLPGQGGE